MLGQVGDYRFTGNFRALPACIYQFVYQFGGKKTAFVKDMKNKSGRERTLNAKK
jgi:hypothetical protein